MLNRRVFILEVHNRSGDFPIKLFQVLGISSAIKDTKYHISKCTVPITTIVGMTAGIRNNPKVKSQRLVDVMFK